mmetsp:Transcript_21225/g.82354  ORF Transcript_21225/g.82354 Transcript_21225/m.82354 type:complete len:226 (+) Transcript_21225:472-1149(+)
MRVRVIDHGRAQLLLAEALCSIVVEHSCHWRRSVLDRARVFVPSTLDHDGNAIKVKHLRGNHHSTPTPGQAMSTFSTDNKNKEQLRAAGRCTEVVHEGKPNERVCGSRSVSIDAHGFCKDHRKKHGLNKGAFSAKRIAARRRLGRCERLQREQYRRIRTQDVTIVQMTIVRGWQQDEAVTGSVQQARETVHQRASPTAWPSARTSQPARTPEQQQQTPFFHFGAL